MHFTPSELWAHMGLFARAIVAILAAMSVASMVVILERAVHFRKLRRDSGAFAARTGRVLAKGDLETTEASGDEIGYLGRVIVAGLTAYRTASLTKIGGAARRGSALADAKADLVFESVARALERQAQREAQDLKRGLTWLATVSSTAPFVGLLGTVMGIVSAFQGMADTGSSGLGAVSAGIAEALVTTAFGLVVAIPAVMAHNALQGWVDARAVDIAESSNELLDVVARKLAEAGGTEDDAEAAE